MGVFDKIKNALFEEEYVEVEDKPEKPKKSKKELFKEKHSIINANKPIAKKVVLPPKDEETEVEDKAMEEEPVDEDFDINPKDELTASNQFDFPIQDSDLVVDNKDDSEPQIVKIIDEEEQVEPKEDEKEVIPYSNSERTSKPYGIDDSNKPDMYQYGTYEHKEEKSYFKPSPIISPIYGILDKNYKKEEIVTKKEVHLTSSYSRENISIEDVRRKAYGEEKKNTPKEDKPSTFKITDDENAKKDEKVVDLTDEKAKPAVKDITVGDAEEYFQDLGLEYNVDYKDSSKEKATGRRTDKEEEIPEDVKEEVKEEPKEEKEPTIEVTPIEEGDDSSKEDGSLDNEDNLFDLIDSMYKK
jgi:hypothetical protein